MSDIRFEGTLLVQHIETGTTVYQDDMSHKPMTELQLISRVAQVMAEYQPYLVEEQDTLLRRRHYHELARAELSNRWEFPWFMMNLRHDGEVASMTVYPADPITWRDRAAQAFSFGLHAAMTVLASIGIGHLAGWL